MKRLSEELPDGFARELLESAQHDAPRPGPSQRGLAAAVAAVPVKSAAATLVLGKVGLAVLVAASIGGGAAAVHAVLAPRPMAHRTAEPVIVAPPPAREAARSELEVARVEAFPGPSAPGSSRPAKSTPMRQSLPSTPEASAAPVEAHAVAAETASLAAPSRAGASGVNPVAAPLSDDLRAQVQLIERARLLVDRGDAAALPLLDSYARQWPQGPFAIDVAVLAIEAERKSGAVEQARARAQRVLADHPSAAYQARVRRALNDASIP